MKLTNPERLIISMLASLHQKAGITDYQPDLIERVIGAGNEWAIQSALPGVFDSAPDPLPAEVAEVAGFLDMWEFIERGLAALTTGQKAQVFVRSRGYTQFPGFDGNGEAEQLSIAATYINELARFQHFAGRNLNSHAPTLQRYRTMYAVFHPLLQSGAINGQLNHQQLINIMSA